MIFRELSPSEYDLLKTFLYEAIFIPEGAEPPDRSIIELPELSLYYNGFGKEAADICVVAENECRVVGAAWVRIMNDYGHIDNQTPSLAMSVLKDYRGQGIGTHLLQELITLLNEKGYNSSSVAKYWRIRTGINQRDCALSTEMDLALALENYEGVSGVDFETVWGQGHTMAERTGNSTDNFITWINECMSAE